MPPPAMPSIITGLDHIRIVATDLATAIADYAVLFGRPPAWRERRFGAEAAGFVLGGLQLIVTEAEADGLCGLGFRVTDALAAKKRLERLGMGPIEGRDGEFSLAPEVSRGLALSFTSAPPSDAAAHSGAVQTLDHVVINTGDGEATAALFGARLGLDLRAVVSNPKWGARLYFFRCGASVVELAERSDGKADPKRDAFSGLAWRVDDAAALQARLCAEGVDVSDVRDGRKPGTKVFTVRDRTSGVPTLMIQQARR